MSIQFNVYKLFDEISDISFDSILNYFKNNFYQKLFIKNISDDLILIHNNFDKTDNDNIDLYNECRSIIIDISSIPKVISYSHENIISCTLQQYVENNEILATNQYEESYEGSLISVFYYKDRWYFTTTRCGDIDKSYFYNKNKSFGVMFDECLAEFNLSRETMGTFLNTNICYYFVLVHHENKNIVDYTSRLGLNYKKLVHVFTREKESQRDIIIDRLPFAEYAIKFENMESAVSFLNTMDTQITEGIIIKSYLENGKFSLTKIHSDQYLIEKQRNPNYPNRWFSYIYIYQCNDNNFRIKDYQEKKNIVENLQINDKDIDVTGMLFIIFKYTAEALFDLVVKFTIFNFTDNTYVKINSDEYEVLKAIECSALRKQIAVLQTLVSKMKIRNSSNIINHLRRHVSVEDFVNIMHGIKYLLKNTRMIKSTNTFFSKYINIYIKQLLE